MIPRAGVLIRTLLRLRARQWLMRPWSRVAPLAVRRFVKARRVDQSRLAEWARSVDELDREDRLEEAIRSIQGRWRYIGSEVVSHDPPFSVSMPKLWRYEMKYRGWLAGAARLASERPAEWVRLREASLENLETDSESWEPYVLSRRFWSEAVAAGITGDARLGAIAGRTINALAWMPEHHLGANHLLSNRATIAAGRLLDGESDPAAVVQRYVLELRRQFDRDYVHEERSPAYALLALLDMKRVLAAAVVAGVSVDALATLEAGAARALSRFMRPDRTLPSFHDGTSEAGPGGLKTLLDSSREGGWDMPDSGFSGWCGELMGNGLSIVADFGHPRPTHQPGHQHAAPFALDLWWGGGWFESLGISTYEPGPRRLLERGPQAHACSEVDGAIPAELWSSFRMGGGFTVSNRAVELRPDAWRISATHDGYDPVVTTRSIEWSASQRCLVIRDGARGGNRHRLTVRFPLNPDVAIQARDRTLITTREHRRITIEVPREVAISVNPETSCRKFGEKLETNVIRLDLEGTSPLEIVSKLRFDAR